MLFCALIYLLRELEFQGMLWWSSPSREEKEFLGLQRVTVWLLTTISCPFKDPKVLGETGRGSQCHLLCFLPSLWSGGRSL